MRLTLQTHFNGEWHDAATLELKDDAAGFLGASIVDYDLDYFVAVASAEFATGKTVRDHRALSVRYPVDLENRYSRSWPPFLLDGIPHQQAPGRHDPPVSAIQLCTRAACQRGDRSLHPLGYDE